MCSEWGDFIRLAHAEPIRAWQFMTWPLVIYGLNFVVCKFLFNIWENNMQTSLKIKDAFP